MITLLEKFRKPLTNGMSVLTLIAFLGFQLVGRILVDVFNINETMGWKLSVMRTWIDDVPAFLFLMFLGVYTILNLLKIKTNLILSAIHFLLIGLSSLLYNFWEFDIRVHLFIMCISIIIFGKNVYEALFRINK